MTVGTWGFKQGGQSQKIFIQMDTYYKGTYISQHFNIRVILVAVSKYSLPFMEKNLARNTMEATNVTK